MDTFLKKLETFKQKGVYAVSVYYGEGEGADDSDIPVLERNIQIVGTPVGYLGSVRVLIRTTVQGFLDMDFNSPLTQLPNPLKEIPKEGYYYWGTESALDGVTPTTVFKM